MLLKNQQKTGQGKKGKGKKGAATAEEPEE
jgi:hypothetical protein